MTQTYTIRAAVASDIPAIASIADATLFPGDMTADMIAPFLADPESARWLVAEKDSALGGFLFAQPEDMTDRTWNLKAIAVAEQARRQGAGRALILGFEASVKDAARLVVIDTTQTEDQAAGRALYARCGYAQVAVIKDFWEPGADRVTFAKPVSA